MTSPSAVCACGENVCVGVLPAEHKQYISTCEYNCLVRNLQSKDSGTQIDCIELTQAYNGAAVSASLSTIHGPLFYRIDIVNQLSD